MFGQTYMKPEACSEEYQLHWWQVTMKRKINLNSNLQIPLYEKQQSSELISPKKDHNRANN